MSAKMQNVVTKIMSNAGRTAEAEFSKALAQRSDFHLTATVPGFMKLVIEVTPAGEVSVAHYTTQDGDSMRDPEIVFNPKTWHAVEITQDFIGKYNRARPGCYLRDAEEFATFWATNLVDQGFTKTANISY